MAQRTLYILLGFVALCCIPLGAALLGASTFVVSIISFVTIVLPTVALCYFMFEQNALSARNASILFDEVVTVHQRLDEAVSDLEKRLGDVHGLTQRKTFKQGIDAERRVVLCSRVTGAFRKRLQEIENALSRRSGDLLSAEALIRSAVTVEVDPLHALIDDTRTLSFPPESWHEELEKLVQDLIEIEFEQRSWGT